MSSTQVMNGGARRQMHEGVADGRFDWIRRGCERLMKTGGGSLAGSRRAYVHLTPEQKQEAARLCRVEHWTQEAIATHFGTSQDMISKTLRAMGINARPYRLAQAAERRAAFRALLSAGNSLEDAARLAGYSEHYAQTLASKNKWPWKRKAAA